MSLANENSAVEVILESHEERIQRSETLASQVAAQMATMSEQLKQVGERVAEVGKSLKGDIASFRETNTQDHNSIRCEVESLRMKSEEHSQQLVLLLSDRELREKRIKVAKQVSIATVIAVLGGVATKWGETIYAWLGRILVHKGL